MAKLMQAYAQKKGQSHDRIHFTFEGNRISPQQTAEQVGLEDGDMIETKIAQLGGQ